MPARGKFPWSEVGFSSRSGFKGKIRRDHVDTWTSQLTRTGGRPPLSFVVSRPRLRLVRERRIRLLLAPVIVPLTTRLFRSGTPNRNTLIPSKLLGR